MTEQRHRSLSPMSARSSGRAAGSFKKGRFCWSAIRRPTPTAVEVVTGQDLNHLAVKLRAEMDGAQQ